MEDFFNGYISTNVYLTSDEQQEKFVAMHLKEIRERAIILKDLNFDKSDTKQRIKDNIEWGFDSMALPGFIKEVDEIVDNVYAH